MIMSRSLSMPTCWSQAASISPAFRAAGEERRPQSGGGRNESKGDVRFDRGKLEQLSAATNAATLRAAAFDA